MTWRDERVLAVRAARTILYRRLGRSDWTRWSDDGSLHEAWDARTAALAEWLPPGRRVLELGAGRRSLARFLPPESVYLPSDLVDRGPGTFVCDLNGPSLPVFPDHDVVVCSGVLEYVFDLARLVAHLTHGSAMVLASYAATDLGPRAPLRRRSLGWVNDYSLGALERLFRESGYELARQGRWRQQALLQFERCPSADGGGVA